MAIGANVSFATRKQVLQKILTALGMKPNGLARPHGKICWKAGAPSNNTVADNPNALHDILYDTTNSNVYICTLYSADASATTWVKINA